MTVAHQIDQITIRFIPYSDMRYPTAGDWYFEGTTLVLPIARTEDPRHQQLVAVHELVEALICNLHGVTQEAVDAFDMGLGKDLDDPGEHPDAPYRQEHAAATVIEYRLATDMGVDWAEYGKAIERLGDYL